MEWVIFVYHYILRSSHGTRESRRDAGFIDEAEILNPRPTVGLAHLLAEMVLQLLALGWMVRTVKYGDSRGFYHAGRNVVEPYWMRTMYDSAAAYLVLGIVALVLQMVQVWLSVVAARQWREDEDEADIARKEEAMRTSRCRFVHEVRCWLTLLTVLGAWMACFFFWIGFVSVAQVR